VRTTLTLDSDVVQLLQDAIHRERRTMKQVVNDALRQALRPAGADAGRPYHLQPHESSLRPGLDLTGFNRLADELEDEQVVERARRSA
jgi:hypothetical protein